MCCGTNALGTPYSRDKRPDLLQVVVCLAVDRRGWPVAWEVFPGNTAGRPAFEVMVAKLRERFCIGRVCVVADRGMIARDTLAYLTGHETPWDYILGCRLRGDKAVRDIVLADPAPFRSLADGLEVKDVRLGERRYVVCHNPAAEVVHLYKGLWRVERAFREVKSTLEVRPIYHQNDEACVGHAAFAAAGVRPPNPRHRNPAFVVPKIDQRLVRRWYQTSLENLLFKISLKAAASRLSRPRSSPEPGHSSRRG